LGELFKMKDAVTSLIKNYDLNGRYFDRDAMEQLKSYFNSASARLAIAAVINANAASIVKASGVQLFEEVPELIRAGGNAYTTRRYSACLRDLDYYLRYASYALVAGDTDVLDERVLQGLRETYNSLAVSIGPTVRGVAIMKDLVKAKALESGISDLSSIDEPFDHICAELGEISL
jgi:phycobilisome core component